MRFGVGEYEHASFVEVDRATASAPTVARKLDCYRRFWQTGREQERFGVFPRVVLLAPHGARREVLAEAVARQPAEARPLYQTGLYAEAVGLLTGEAS